jgi:hypothetical protein
MTPSSLHSFIDFSEFNDNSELNAARSASPEIPRQTSPLSFSWSENYEVLSNSPAWNEHHVGKNLVREDLHMPELLNSERIWRENGRRSAAPAHSRPERLTFLATCQTTQAWPYHNSRKSAVHSELKISPQRLKRPHPDSFLCQADICDADVHFDIPTCNQNITLEEINLGLVLKRLKTSVSRCSRTRSDASLASPRNELKYANESASLRRAKSLRRQAPLPSCDNNESLASGYGKEDWIYALNSCLNFVELDVSRT